MKPELAPAELGGQVIEDMAFHLPLLRPLVYEDGEKPPSAYITTRSFKAYLPWPMNLCAGTIADSWIHREGRGMLADHTWDIAGRLCRAGTRRRCWISLIGYKLG